MIIKDVLIANYDNVIDCADIEFDEFITKITPKKGIAKYLLVPGFIDTHIHGFMGDDVMDSPEALKRIAHNLALRGVTSFMPTAMTASWDELNRSLTHMNLQFNNGAKNIGIHIEGPFIGEAKKGAHKSEWLRKATKSDIETLVKSSNNFLRKISFDPLMFDKKLVHELQKHNIQASIGHTIAGFEIAAEYFKSGVNCICHLWNAMTGFDSRNPGLVQAAVQYPVYSEIIADLHHICERTLDQTLYMLDEDHIMCISDAIRPAYGPDGKCYSGGVAIEKKGNIIYLEGTKTIAGSAICLHDAFLNLLIMKHSLKNVVKWTSYNAAVAYKLKKVAYISEGYYADFVLLDCKNLSKIMTVYINGKKIE
ncbi:amidohydrolase family protein [Mycoplasmopsis caviae]|uniref:Amidohydrolase family protein n=1 Tax=Mycoplasmopsis caviae TaxID=55603 RepID=A0A3P8MF48_9BACT|nr:amidohydrolase family protein [Mycoplasmopsis caviae]UUD35681.1 amidohydrolase family protein [Mycoplasmopsis caviae]VDR41573.1 N-acetylglucosamine-6-phosphate deacetylase [Mycoplasmopsis caviae]